MKRLSDYYKRKSQTLNEDAQTLPTVEKDKLIDGGPGVEVTEPVDPDEHIPGHIDTPEEKRAKEEAKKALENKPYFFKNILFFTNDRTNSNKTLENLREALKESPNGEDITLSVFVADEISYKASDEKIDFKDGKNKYTIDKQSNIDTIVISRLGVQKSEECMELIKELQEWGLFVINPIQSARRASNKYTSAVLMERNEIPQPAFTLVSKNDIKDGITSLNAKLKAIYPNVGKNAEEDDKNEYVVKILDGHGGTGVFMTNGKTILGILQAIFAIDEERELLVQKKEQADGDIRVHVLTMRTEQKILAAMKRVKIKGDFRSNVSLGATAEKVELTEEQKEIAKKCAKISGMPWCAVDIMPLEKDSNPELGDNVVLEFNSSPGTDGISEVIDENFMKILLDNINDVNQLVLSPKSIGYIENIHIKMNEYDELVKEAKLDTGNGAKASTIGCDKLIIDQDDVVAIIDDRTYHFTKYGESNAILGNEVEKRVTVVVPEIQIGTRKLLNVEFALVDNRKKEQKILLNRDVLSKMGYMVNPAKKHTTE